VIEARAEEWLKENAANCNDSLGYATTLIKDLLSENRFMREENNLHTLKSEIRKLSPLDGNISVKHQLADGLPESWSACICDKENICFVAQCHFATSPERLMKDLKSEVGYNSKSQVE